MSEESLAPPSPDMSVSAHDDAPVPEGWRSVMMITWLLVFGAMTAVAVSSRTIGRSVWWLGPTVDPVPVVAILVPVAICLAPVVATVRRSARTGHVGVASALLLGVTALPDLPDRPGVAVLVLVIALGAVLSSGAVAVATRNYR